QEGCRPEEGLKRSKALHQTPSGGPGWCFFWGVAEPRNGTLAPHLTDPTNADSTYATAASSRGQDEHAGRPDLLVDDRVAHPADHLGGVLALRAEHAARLGLRHHDHDVRHAFHDGRCLHSVEERPRPRRRAVRLLSAAAAGGA